MRVLSSASLIEKNKLATDSAWLILLEIGFTEPIQIIANNEDVLWDSKTWQAFPFEVDTIGESGKGEIVSVGVKVSNVTGEIQQIVESLNGANNTPVVVRVINTVTATTTPDLELNFVVDSSSFDEQWLTFKLTGGVCLTRRVPQWRYLQNFCRFTERYGGIECGVSAATKVTFPTCNGTNANCIERGNAVRYGGFRWMPK